MARILINIDVPDLAAGIAFYADGLGFELQRRLFNGGVAEMLCGTQSIYLIAQAAGTLAIAGQAAVRDYGDHWTPMHLDLVVNDVDTALAKAVAAGARVSAAARDHVYGRLASLRDPFGHGFCLIAFTADGYHAVPSGRSNASGAKTGGRH